MLQTGILDQLLLDCAEVTREAADARESDWGALVGCLADRNNESVVDLRKQSEDFLALSERLANWSSRVGEVSELNTISAKQHLLADLRLALTAIRVAAFDIGLHGRGAKMSDYEIADLLGRYARLDFQLRANIIPPLKADLGVTETVAV
jgi:hypothetical protein